MKNSGRAVAEDAEDGFIYFELESTPRQDRQKVWKESLNQFFYDYEFRLPENFSMGKIEGCYAGELSIANVESDPMTVYRTQSHIACDSLDAYFVLLPNVEQICLGQRGGEAVVGGNQFALVSTSETYSYVQPSKTLFNNLIIPGSILRQLSPNADELVALPSRNDPVSRMFTDFANSLCLGIRTIKADHRDVIGRQAVELLSLVLDGADFTSSATPILIAHHRRIAKLIEREYSRNTFDLQEISDRSKLSKRYIQSIFSIYNETVSGVLRRRRIKEACRLLRHRKKTRISISQTAYSVGFVSLAHFSRVFKEETGYSPRDFPTMD